MKKDPKKTGGKEERKGKDTKERKKQNGNQGRKKIQRWKQDSPSPATRRRFILQAQLCFHFTCEVPFERPRKRAKCIKAQVIRMQRALLISSKGWGKQLLLTIHIRATQNRLVETQRLGCGDPQRSRLPSHGVIAFPRPWSVRSFHSLPAMPVLKLIDIVTCQTNPEPQKPKRLLKLEDPWAHSARGSN